MDGVESQRAVHDATYADRSSTRWAFHYTDDPLIRYLRDRRLELALSTIAEHGTLDPATQSALLVCGGIGGEGTYLANRGFSDVTVSDISPEALETCKQFDPRLKTRVLNAEDMAELPDSSVDLVLVQDGLHHLPRPALGFTEMIRVARHAVVVIEPHYGMVGTKLGTEWEVQGDAINYVFRWNAAMFEQIVRSYTLRKDAQIYARRVWDHNVVVGRAAGKLPSGQRLRGAKAIYGALRPANRFGNMMVGVVIKPTGPSPERLATH